MYKCAYVGKSKPFIETFRLHALRLKYLHQTLIIKGLHLIVSLTHIFFSPVMAKIHEMVHTFYTHCPHRINIHYTHTSKMSFLKKYVNVKIIIFTCILGQIMSSLLCDHKDVYAYKEKVRFYSFLLFLLISWWETTNEFFKYKTAFFKYLSSLCAYLYIRNDHFSFNS